MPSKIQLDENLWFLYICLQKSDIKSVLPLIPYLPSSFPSTLEPFPFISLNIPMKQAHPHLNISTNLQAADRLCRRRSNHKPQTAGCTDALHPTSTTDRIRHLNRNTWHPLHRSHREDRRSRQEEKTRFLLSIWNEE